MSKKRSAWSSHARWSETTAREALNALASSALGPEAFASHYGFSGQRLRQWSKRLRTSSRIRMIFRCRMILLPSSVRVYVATAAANLRKSFEGLSNEVRCVLGDDPLSGHVFLFLNRRGCQVKMLVWTRGGFTIVHKRLERGRFTFPERVRADAVRVEIDAHEGSPRRSHARQTPGRE